MLRYPKAEQLSIKYFIAGKAQKFLRCFFALNGLLWFFCMSWPQNRNVTEPCSPLRFEKVIKVQIAASFNIEQLLMHGPQLKSSLHMTLVCHVWGFFYEIWSNILYFSYKVAIVTGVTSLVSNKENDICDHCGLSEYSRRFNHEAWMFII